MEHVVTQYLKTLKVPVSRKYCEKLIRSHPEYPSLLSISDTLTRLGIDHKAARVSKENLTDLEVPFLVQLNTNGSGLTVINHQKDLTEQLASNGQDGHSAAGQDFEGDAVVLLAEPTEEIAGPENREHLSRESFQRNLSIGLLSALAGMILLASVALFSWIYLSLIVTAIVGAAVGYLLVAMDVGVTYDPVENFCRAGRKANCDAILHSDEARLFSNVSFSDAVAGYFLFQLLILGVILPVTQTPENFLTPLALLSAFTIPVVIYSLYYQAVKAKTWCRLCLIVDAALIVQAGLFGSMWYSGVIGISFLELFPVVTSFLLFLLVITSVLLLKDTLKKANESEQNEIQALRVKNSPEVFTNLLFQEKKVDTAPFERELLIGNPDTPIKITMASSISCSPCKDGFEKALQVVTTFPEKANLAVRFKQTRTTHGRSTLDQNILLTFWLHHIYGKNNESERTANLIRDWYSLIDIEKLKKKHSLKTDADNSAGEDLMVLHGTWFEKSEIQGTPSFFINGYQLPRHYKVDDLMIHVLWLEEYLQEEKNLQKIQKMMQRD